MVLRPRQGQRPRETKALSPIMIPSLKEFIGEDEPEALSCPVTNTTLNIWVKLLVRAAYTESGVENKDSYQISAHQIRHITSVQGGYTSGFSDSRRYVDYSEYVPVTLPELCQLAAMSNWEI